MTVDDLQDLYSELRGSRSAPAIMDARAHFLERQWQDSLTSLTDAYETYCESRQRILRQDPEKQIDAKAKDRDRQVRRIKRKQDKARELIERFEEYLPQLQKLAEKERAKVEAKAEAAAKESAASAAEAALLRKESIEEAFLKQFAILIGDRQLGLVSSRFGFRPLETTSDAKEGAVYLLRKGDRCFLLHAEVVAGDDSRLNCVDLCSAKNHVELSRERMVKLSRKHRLVLLLNKDSGGESDQ